MEPRERIKQVRKALHLSQAALASQLGVVPLTVTRWELGTRPTDRLVLLAIASLTGASIQWLESGEGSMWMEAWKQGNPRPTVDIPLLVGCPSCGPGGEVQDPGVESVPFSVSFIESLLRQCGAGTPGNLYATHVLGDSMAPTILNGDLLLVNNALDLRLAPRNGALYLVRLAENSGDTRVKRVFFSVGNPTLTLQSDNKAFPFKLVNIDGQRLQDFILGKVCWYGRHLQDATAPVPSEDW